MPRSAGHRARRWAALALVALLALLPAACGGEESGPRPLSKREYIERSNDLQQEAAGVFSSLDGRVATTPAEAARYLKALDRLITGLEGLQPPSDWKDEHATMLESVRTMRQSMAIVSRASPRNAKAIGVQLERSSQAQRDFEAAVRDINASR